MFNIGPFELVVLAIVGLIVLGPERLPGLARDAARLLRNLREMATGARQQLREELGPEFADVDLRNLNPRTAVRRAVFGDDDDVPDLRKYDPRKYNPGAVVRDAIFGDDGEAAADKPVSMVKPPRAEAAGARPRPRPRPGPGARRNYDDVT
jgi:sec-independent protein translocase protein TatB